MKSESIRVLAFGVAIIALVSCSASPERRAEVAEQEADRLLKTTEPLNAFSNFELKALMLSKDVQADQAKVEVSKQLDTKLTETLLPLLDGWRDASVHEGTPRTLLIQPELVALRVVSGGARFWAGGFAGDSFVDMNLILTESATGKTIANVRINREASAISGAWSIGKSDKNLLDYIVDIARQYLVDNH